jgi:hypothetical protein
MSNSNNNNNNNNDDEREERRKASFALAHTSSTYILALSLLAAGGFAVIISTVTPMTAAIAQELDTTGQPGGGLEYSACTPTQIGGDGGGGSQNTTSNVTTMGGGGGGGDANATADNATTTTTAGGGIGVSTSTSEVIDFIEQACIALEVGDTEGALIQLNLALDELRGGGGTQGNTTDTQSEMTGGTATSG